MLHLAGGGVGEEEREKRRNKRAEVSLARRPRFLVGVTVDVGKQAQPPVAAEKKYRGRALYEYSLRR